MRPYFVMLHRYVGLLIAPFLIVTGLTGAVISWDHELDDLLNPHLMRAIGAGPDLPPLELARRIEERDARIRVSFIPLSRETGESFHFGVRPRVDPATGRLFRTGYNQVFIDPATGDELGRREWGAVSPINRETFVSFLYKLHFTLHFPEVGGIDRWGIWLLGGIALLWIVDCFSGAYLTFPAPRRHANRPPRPWLARWKAAWLIRRDTGRYKFNYDLHRAVSLWTWLLLLVLAFTAFSLNLYREVFFPLMTKVSAVTPTPFDTRVPASPRHPREAAVGFTEIVDRAHAEARRREWSAPPGSIFYSTAFGVYGVQFFHPGEGHGSAGVGPARLYFDGADGRLLGERLPWHGTAADLFVQAQFPLHSGRILGLPGRVLISLMGIVIAMLSITGLYLWWRKWRGRMRGAARDASRRAA